MIEGHFIVLEGIDGAGTTTQLQLLASRLRRKGLPVHSTREPSDGPVGMIIRQVLTGRLVVPGVSGGRALSSSAMALLFAADRMDHLDAEIIPNLLDGVSVLSDRYDHSSVAYQAASDDHAEQAVRWIQTINQRARRPDLTIVLDVSSETAARRRRERAGRPEIYDDPEFQARLAQFYTKLEQHFPNDAIQHINGERESEVVAEEVWAAVEALRKRG